MPLSRRQFILRTLAAGAAAGLGLAGYTHFIEPFWVEWVHRPLPIKHLPDHLQGETLLQISDIHVGPRVQLDYLKRSLAELRPLDPAFVVYTGDFVSYRSPQEFEVLDEVLREAPRGRRGTAAVLGNHDYGHHWSDQRVADEMVRRLQNHAITPLVNEKKVFDGLHIYGVDSFWGPNMSLAQTFATYEVDQPAVTLCHNPDALDQPGWDPYEGWVLAGHTHGGQCRPPFLPPPVLPVQNKRYTAGHIPLENGRHLYINRGLGFFLQVRFLARPEITIFELVNDVVRDG